MSFFENTRKPVGFGGKIMVAMMNVGHSAVARWGLQFLNAAPDAKVLDCGCGGGANIKRLLKKCPEGIVKGIDYSPVSVEKSKKVNEAAIAEGRCTVLQGSVADMIFAGDWFDAVTAFETVYFWPDLPQCFREVYRVLKPGGTLLICNESNGDTDSLWYTGSSVLLESSARPGRRSRGSPSASAQPTTTVRYSPFPTSNTGCKIPPPHLLLSCL